MLDVPSRSGLIAQPAPGIPVAKMVIGRSPEEVATILPRLFNLCRSAQAAAVNAALGRAYSTTGLASEILRDHLLKFAVAWPSFFGLPPMRLPDGWMHGGDDVRRMVFGPSGAAPSSSDAFFGFLESGAGFAPILKRIDGCFAPGDAVAEGQKPVTSTTIWNPGADNSVAARHASHPAMIGIAGTRGKGPLWRAAARLFDLTDILNDSLPPIRVTERGKAVVPAARGSYAVKVTVQDDLVTDFVRVTPTDHLLAPGGVLESSLATLPATKAGLAQLLLDILDPCSPVRLRQVSHA